MTRRLAYTAAAAVLLTAGASTPAPAVAATIPIDYVTTAQPLGMTWTHHDGHWPVIDVQDRTDGRWYVRAAVKAVGSGLRYHHCQYGVGCIRISSPMLGKDISLGRAFIYGPRGLITGVVIQMNRWDQIWERAVQLVAVEHMLGHALGLGHDTSYRGVMRAYAYPDGYVNRFERRELRRLYGLQS